MSIRLTRNALQHRSKGHWLGALAGAALALATAFAASTAHADSTLDRIHERHKLVVGVILSGPPFGSLDPATQKPVGFNVDLAENLAKHLGVDIEMIPVQPSNRVQFLQQGKVDALIANMEVTEERAQILAYPPTPFEEIGGALITRKDSGIKTWNDVRGKAVCVSQGSNYAKPLAEQYGAQVKAFRGQPESLLALRGNNCVAAVHVAPTLRLLVARNPDWKDYTIPVSNDLIPSPSVIWVRKGETDTQNAFEKVVEDWHRSGWLIDTERKNGMQPSQAVLDLHAKFKAQPA
ncbi:MULTISPECIES: transporter substrate-binding domain-containing protein [Paraburkholderia]|jgi:polar amino acid transport system substrate-binding protein|uniref:Amino acid ABC transporter substrate-binding protein, PAAT family n=1 Tax=Paraburkholderia phenazinium TaxID=60549 RepID=A0A1N6KW49_9BURK|nr:transporter substrate-binding domain-containing protein [Paraburkholderia phenazinium]SIO60784.1 amino acid ABC transporter substrate-binding protein, PAAT family [Paraburkholderia phenazinium]